MKPSEEKNTRIFGSGLRGGNRAQSVATAMSAEKRAGFKPVTVTGISDGDLILVTPKMFGNLDVDPSYQRGETNMVTQIVRAIQNGGMIPDPVTLCARKGTDKMYIIDGHQRVCAFQHLGVPFKAMLHTSNDVSAEHAFFIAMNSRRAVSANVIVKAWEGQSASVIRKANEMLSHPLNDRVNFSQSASATRLAASSIVGGMREVTGTFNGSGRIEQNLSRIDLVMSASRLQVARVEHYLRLIGMVSPSGTVPHLVLRAIGEIAREHWQSDVKLPTLKVIDKLRMKQWASEAILTEKYRSILVGIVRKTWK
jgi:hypothetical protein